MTQHDTTATEIAVAEGPEDHPARPYIVWDDRTDPANPGWLLRHVEHGQEMDTPLDVTDPDEADAALTEAARTLGIRPAPAIGSIVDRVTTTIAGLPEADRFDAIAALQGNLLAQRDHTIREMRADGTPVTRIAQMAGLSRKAIYDIAPDATFCSELHVWVGDEPNAHWEIIMADTFRTSAIPDEAMAADQLDGWLINGNWVTGSYRCRIVDGDGVVLAEAEAEHTQPG